MNYEYKKKYLKYKRKYLNLEISRIKGGNKQIGGSTYIIISGLLILITAVLTATIILGTIPNPETNMYITQLTDKDKENKELNERLEQQLKKINQKEEQFKDLKERLTSCESTNTYIVPKEILTNKIEDIFTSMDFNNFDKFKTHFSNELSKIRTYQIIADMGGFIMGIIKSNRHLVLEEIYTLKNLEYKLNKLREYKPNDMKQELKKDEEIVTLFKKIEQIMTLNIESIIEKNANTTLDLNIMAHIKKYMAYIIKPMAQNNLNIEVIYDIFIKYINNDSVKINKETLKQIAYKIVNTYVYKNLSLLNNFIESLINSDQVHFKKYIDTFQEDIKQLQQGHNTLTDRFLKGLLNIFVERGVWGTRIAHIFMGHLFVTKEKTKRPQTAPAAGRSRSQMDRDSKQIQMDLDSSALSGRPP